MRKLNLVVILFLFSFLLSGCNWIRTQLGMPTSSELDMATQANLYAASEAASYDSLQKVKADSLALADSLKKAEIPVTDFKYRYHVIVGSFKVQMNSQKMMEFLLNNGYKPAKINFKNGFTLVSAASFDTLQEAINEMHSIMDKDFSPDDIWVYDLNQQLHIK